MINLSINTSILTQQVPNYALFQFYEKFANPAIFNQTLYAIDKNKVNGISISSAMRNQWVRSRYTQRSFFLDAEMTWDYEDSDKFAIGLFLFSDELGPETNGSGYFRFTYNKFLKDSKDLYLGVGVNIGIILNRINLENLISFEDVRTDPTYLKYLANPSSENFDSNIGISLTKIFENYNQISFGLGVPHIYDRNFRESRILDFGINFIPHYFMSIKYMAKLNEELHMHEFTSYIRYVKGGVINADFIYGWRPENVLKIIVGFSTLQTATLGCEFLIPVDIQDYYLALQFNLERSFNNAYVDEIGPTFEFGFSLLF